jgi:integrase
MAKAKRNRGAVPPQRYLNEQQVKKLLKFVRAAATRAEANGSRRAVVTKMIVELLLFTALRAEELCYVRICDLPHHHGKPVLFVRRGKGNVTRSVEVSETLGEEIAAFVKKYRPNAKPRSPLFANERGYRKLHSLSRRRSKTDGRWIIENRSEETARLSYNALYGRIRRLGESAGIGKLHPHMIRHSALTMMYSLECDIEFIRDQAGHRKIDTTQQYIHTSTESRRRQVRAYYSLLSSPNC